jgi:TRAP transporter TAXI family solute receptor
MASCRAPSAPPLARRAIRFATGGPNGPFRAAGAVLAHAYRTRLPQFATEVVLTPAGGIDNVRMLEHDEIDIGFAYAAAAYAAFVGTLPGQTAPFERMRGMALLRQSALHVVSGPRSSVRRVVDLRGRKADLAGAVPLVSESVLTAFGLKPEKIRSVPRPEDSLATLLRGGLDAVFILGLPPVPSVQAALADGAHLVPVEGAPVEQLLRQYPFLSSMLLRPQMYNELPAPVATIGVNGVLLCRGDLDDDTVYLLTKALYEGPGEADVDPALAPWLDVSVGAATPVPLHPGAARYYRERELAR